MSFETKLQLERIEDTSRDGRGTWRLLSPLVYVSEVAGRSFTVPADFITDLASVPRIPIGYLLTGGLGHAAAVIHDAQYTFHQVDRKMADDVLYEAAVSCGVPKWRAWLMWAAVRVAGASSWDAAGPDQPVVVQEFFRNSQVAK